MKDYFTGIWNNVKKRHNEELDFLKNQLSKDGAEEFSKINSVGKDYIKGIRDNDIKEEFPIADKLAGVLPTIYNSGLESFTSKGAGKAALIGAGLGATYGAFSENSSISSNAIKGGLAGYTLKGLQGIPRIRNRLKGEAEQVMEDIAVGNY